MRLCSEPFLQQLDDTKTKMEVMRANVIQQLTVRSLMGAIVAWSVLSTLLSCSRKIVTYADYDRHYDLRQFRTYKWLDWETTRPESTAFFYDTLNDMAIKSAVDAQMKDEGYVIRTENPELLLHYHLIIEEKSQINPALLGYEYGTYWLGKGTDIYQYREGTIILDIMDAKTRTLIWRGWGFSELDEERFSSRQLIRKTVNKIFDDFPSLKQDSF